MKEPLELHFMQETTMRAIYDACGFSAKTTKAAIAFRRKHPIEMPRPSRASNGKPMRRKQPAKSRQRI